MALIDPSLGTILQDHEKRIRDLERRPMGCLEFHDHFLVYCPWLTDLPGPDSYGGWGVGYYVWETNRVWAWVWTDPPEAAFIDWGTYDEWIPPPTEA